MFGLGYQEALLLAIIAGLIIAVVVAIKRKKVVTVAATFGCLQGLMGLLIAVTGGPSQTQLQPSVAVALSAFQGIAMILFAQATYRRKLYGAYGLLVIVVVHIILSLSNGGSPGWILPDVFYLSAVVSLHRARSATS